MQQWRCGYPMLRFSYIFWLPVLILASSCSGKKRTAVTDDSNVVTVEIKDIPRVLLSASKYVDSVKYIKLEDTPEMPIAAISEVFITDSLLIVSEYRQKMVVFYDLNGKYLRRISKRGRGPGEYVTIGNVMVDSVRKNVIIYDDSLRKLLFYDFNGTFIRSIDDFSERKVIRDMINLPDGGFLCYCPDYNGDNYPGGLWYVDENGVQHGEYLYRLDVDYPLYSPQYEYSLYNISGGKIGFAEYVFSNIYHYDSLGLHKILSYRLPGVNLSDMKGTTSFDTKTGIMMMNTESDKFVITFFVTDEHKYGTIIFSKEDHSYEVGELLVDYENNILYGSPVRNNLPGIYSRIVMPSNLPATQNIPDSLKSLIHNLTHGANEDEILKMNPIIQLLYLKN